MGTILLVDDDPDVRPLVREMLEVCGYSVLEAPDCDDAIRMEAGHQEPIQLLMTDVMMPRVPGPQLARQLKARRPEMRVLYMSGVSAQHCQASQVDMEGDDPFVMKPFGLDTLARKVREVLAGSVSSDDDAPADGSLTDSGVSGRIGR
jgi:DNA-binding response OmpR family regulator